eukprot:TRINITY_DN8382_c0_g1_i6.p6 TRINITY_DN8382_c0_g1~~TRINITY_DN8382_c0_g1_i6.p6  ORF type:complete len:101 (+),score=1.01 TRINITY_DN8382_c0_g1_i6:635-937(+)
MLKNATKYKLNQQLIINYVYFSYKQQNIMIKPKFSSFDKVSFIYENSLKKMRLLSMSVKILLDKFFSKFVENKKFCIFSHFLLQICNFKMLKFQISHFTP